MDSFNENLPSAQDEDDDHDGSDTKTQSECEPSIDNNDKSGRRVATTPKQTMPGPCLRACRESANAIVKMAELKAESAQVLAPVESKTIDALIDKMKQMQSQQNTAFASLMQIMGKIAGKLS
jgi:hypothetical protein